MIVTQDELHERTGISPELGDNFPDAAVLLPYQARWFEDDAEVKIAEKSRRTGLTWAEAAANVLTASKPKARGGHNVFYVGSRQEMALEYIAACALFARSFNQLAGEVHEQIFSDSEGDKDILAYTIRFPNSKHKITALSSRPSNLRGMQGDVVIDEAAFHDQLDELLKAAMALTMWGARVRIISTHNGVDNKFNEYINDARAGRKSYSVHRITLDDACKEGLYQRICFVTNQSWSAENEISWKAKLYGNAPTSEAAEEEYGCVPTKSSGAYLSRALIEARMHDAPVVRLTLPDVFKMLPEQVRVADTKDWCKENLHPLLSDLDTSLQHCFGEDFGRSGDLTIICPLFIDQNLKRKAPFMLELRNVPFEQQKQILFYVVDRLPRFKSGKLDARGNGQYLAEVAAQEYGSRIEEVAISQAWYMETMPKMKGAFESGELIVPKDADVLNDLQALRVVNGIARIPDKKTESSDGKQRHGDAAIAIAMAYAASLADAVHIEYQGIARQKDLQAQDFMRPNHRDDQQTNKFGSGGW